MTVSHKDLTGTDLHEIKGASTATSGQVPVANGSGGAPFGKLTASSLTGTGNAFGGQLLHMQEQQPSGVAGVTSTGTGAYVINALNAVLTNEIVGASLSVSSFTLPAGTYFIDAWFPWTFSSAAGPVYFCAPALVNSSTLAVLMTGPPVVAYGQSAGGFKVHMRGRFTLAAPTAVSLRSYKNIGSIGGTGAGFSPEIYSDVCVWKVA